jgi:hypothetical protein
MNDDWVEELSMFNKHEDCSCAECQKEEERVHLEQCDLDEEFPDVFVPKGRIIKTREK